EMRILYIEGKLRYESKFIAQALAAANRFSLDRRILLQPLRAGRPPALSEELDDWLVYHAIIIGDVHSNRFTDIQLEIMKKVVGEYGKGLCMIGGDNSFGRGGWDTTPIADVLGVILDGADKQIVGSIKVIPTRRGLASDMMRIGADEDVAGAWNVLDALPGANLLGKAKIAAQVLATTSKGPAEPLIVAQPYGSGRSLAIAFDMTHKWVLTESETAASQKRFWRQVALYLCAPRGNVSITTDRTVYDLAKLTSSDQAITVTARVEDSTGRMVSASAGETVSLLDGEGKKSLITLRSSGMVRQGKITVSTAGMYTLKFSASVEGKIISAEHRFEVINRDVESIEVLANHDQLRHLSTETNGTFVPLARLSDLFEYISASSEEKTVPRIRYANLVDDFRWYIVGLLIALLCMEWALRKRKSLV
ncbi:MAG TPA: hypothetical protein ENL03_00330, partial [Phycisphaerae bacterium]|nr:hypothetical protein [Phycisphaerae bacterium]